MFCDQGVGSCEMAAVTANRIIEAMTKSLICAGKKLFFIKREIIMPNQASNTSNTNMMFALCSFCLNDGSTKNALGRTNGRMGLGESQQFDGVRIC